MPTAYLSIVADNIHPFYDYSVPFFWWLLQAGWCTHVTKLKLSQTSFLNMTRVHFTQMASTVTRSPSNRAPLGWWWKRIYSIYIYIYIYTHIYIIYIQVLAHIIKISSKSWFISLIPFKKWNLYNVYIHSTQTDIFQVFISFNFDDYN